MRSPGMWHCCARTSTPPPPDWFVEPGRLRVFIHIHRSLCFAIPAYIRTKERHPRSRPTPSLKAPKNKLELYIVVPDIAMMTRKVAVDAREAEEMRRRNAELERAVAEAAAREERLRRELEAALARLAVAEEGEERLCVQLGELEAEAVVQAVEYQEHVRALSERLAFADGVLRTSGIRGVAAGVGGRD
ncbi:hypothetical protein BAE44_0007860 [Dichanthelium oligosanthes]|uniref:Uncharacterized protein n=1 Tax=Dichanthelium oligosanthes TaxID=888268 RepID=A0A1E5W183_9POAL|nr:hypothetical protein BAE44_0007860 [Dichanthelium oligosanthes]